MDRVPCFRFALMQDCSISHELEFINLFLPCDRVALKQTHEVSCWRADDGRYAAAFRRGSSGGGRCFEDFV